MHHFGALLVHIADRKRNGTFHAVQVVVDPRSGQYDHRGRHPQQSELCGQVLLKHILYMLDRLFGVLDVFEQVAVSGRFYQCHLIGRLRLFDNDQEIVLLSLLHEQVFTGDQVGG